MTNQDVENLSKECSKTKNLPEVTEWYSTGCTVLDIAIANSFPGGFPVGRIVHFYGGSSTCKTVLAVTTCGYVQRAGNSIYYADVEHTLDPAFSKVYGLDCNDEKTFHIGHPVTLEELFDDYIAKIIRPGKKLDTSSKMIVVDSITALPAAVETKESMIDSTYGTSRAKQMSKGFRKYIFDLAESNTTLFCIDQTRDNVGSPFEGEVTSGGRALEFYSSVQVYLKMDTKIKNTAGRVIGNWIKFRIDKNKVGPPLREGRFRILYDYGLDDIASNLYFLSEIQNGPQAAKNKSTKIKFLDQECRMSTAIKYVEENNLEKELQAEVWKVWKEVYKTEKRKPRVW